MINKVNEFKFIECERDELLNLTDFNKLLNEEVTGIVFKNFLSTEEVELIQNKFNNLPLEHKTIINDGFHSYPLSFAQFTQLKNINKINLEEYIEIANKVLKNQVNEIGINITDKLINFFLSQKMFQEVSPIIDTQYNKPLIPFNVRELFPGNGELVVHCENLFFKEFPNFFNWLKIMDIKDNKLSYFITVQKPEIGGELCCYDLNWKDVKERKTHTQLEDLNGNTIDINDEHLQKHLIKPEEGDLLLFAGGNVWHKVLTVKGDKSRITIGGFIAETNTQGKYYIWS